MKLLIVMVATLAVASAASTHNYSSGRVVGGEDAKADQAPFIASVRLHGTHSCGGSIIAPDWILTAAHCVVAWPVTSLTISYGNYRRSLQTTVLTVAAKFAHEEYNQPARHWNDIALLKLSKPIELEKGVAEIVELETKDLTDGTEPITLFGWGRNASTGHIQDVLQKVELVFYEYGRCLGMHTPPNRPSVGPKHFCTFTKTGVGACNGDSGGPLVYNGVQVALGNWGVGCASGYPDVNCRISSYVDWIKRTMEANA